MALFLAAVVAIALGIALAPYILPLLGTAIALVAIGALWGLLAAIGGVLARRIDVAMLPLSRPITDRLDRWDAWMNATVRRRLPRWMFNERLVVLLCGGLPAILLTVFVLYITTRA